MQKYTVQITPQAKEQLAEIAHYIAFTLQAPGAALRILAQLEQEIASLSCFPNRIARTEEEPWHSFGLRKMTVNHYLVYFWVNEDTHTVQVTAVVYGRRDQRQMLSQMDLGKEQD